MQHLLNLLFTHGVSAELIQHLWNLRVADRPCWQRSIPEALLSDSKKRRVCMLCVCIWFILMCLWIAPYPKQPSAVGLFVASINLFMCAVGALFLTIHTFRYEKILRQVHMDVQDLGVHVNVHNKTFTEVKQQAWKKLEKLAREYQQSFEEGPRNHEHLDISYADLDDKCAIFSKFGICSHTADFMIKWVVDNPLSDEKADSEREMVTT